MKYSFRFIEVVISLLLLLPTTGWGLNTSTSRQTANWNASDTWSSTRTGTIAVNNGSTTVTGTGTLFTTELSPGDVITSTGDGVLGTVSSITNNTSLTLTSGSAATNNGSYKARVVPSSGDDAVISISHTLTVTASASCNNVTLNGGNGNTGLRINSGVTLSLNGNLTVSNPNVGQTNSVTVDGTLSVAGTYTATSTLSTRIVTLAFAASSSCTITGLYTSSGSTTDMTNGGTLTLGAAGTAWSNTGTFTSGTGTVVYNNASPQTVLATTYNNLTLGGGGSKTTTGVTVNGQLIMSGTATASAAPTYGGSASLAYDGSSAQTAGPELPSTVSVAVTITNANGNGLNLSSSTAFNSTLTVTGVFTPTSGTVVSGTGTLTGTGTAKVTRATGSADFAGQYTISNKTLTNLTVEFAGSSTQGSSTTPYGNLKLNNASGVTLSAPTTVNGTLTLTSGKITLGTNNFTIGASGSISGAGSSSYVVTDNTGVLTRNSVGASNVVFPVGISTTYNPATINNAGTTDDFSVRVQSSFDNAPTDADKVVNRQWTITEATGGGSSATITVQWNTASDEATGFVRADPIYIGRYTGTQWVQAAATSADVGGGSYTASASGFTSFSPFGVGNNNALPIQLASFAAYVVRNNDVEVSWKTVSETNNYGFEVYRKRGESGEWKKIAFVEGHGTTLAPQSYSYIDRLVLFGKYYYRIKQLDLDGKTKTYPEMEVSVGVGPDRFLLAQNYPNPFNPSTVIEFAVPQNGYTSLKVYNMLGQEVATLFDGNADAGIVYTVPFNASRLPSGVYFYTLRSQVKIETKRMILIK